MRSVCGSANFIANGCVLVLQNAYSFGAMRLLFLWGCPQL